MYETVDVLVQVFDRGQTRTQIVQVEETCFEPEKSCWKTVACVKAAVLLELPFAWMMERAKYGLKPEDKARLRKMYGGRPMTAPTGDESGRPMTAPTDGPQAALAMTETKEEAST